MLPFVRPDVLPALVMRNQAHDEIRSIYNKPHAIFYLYASPLNKDQALAVLDEANRVVGKCTTHLLHIEPSSVTLLSSLLDLSKKTIKELADQRDKVEFMQINTA